MYGITVKGKKSRRHLFIDGLRKPVSICKKLEVLLFFVLVKEVRHPGWDTNASNDRMLLDNEKRENSCHNMDEHQSE